MLETMQDSM